MSQNLKLFTPVELVYRRDIILADPTLLNPRGSNPLVQGEWVEYDASYKAIRAAGTKLPFQVFTEAGRTDTQAIRKANVLYMGNYEADTLVFDATALADGDPLMVADVTFDSLTRKGLKKHGGGSELIVGYVLRLPANNGQKLRFVTAIR